MTDITPHMPERAILIDANINPDTGLATDYLNVFNEYIMLAELVDDGSMEPEILTDWQPVDYEGHFVQSNFVGTAVVLSAYRALDGPSRAAFEAAVNGLIDLILSHQSSANGARPPLLDISAQRDIVAALISGSGTPETEENTQSQAEIDALFD